MGWESELLDFFFFFFQAEDGIRDIGVTGVQTCALPISHILTTVNALSEEDRPQHQDHYPALFDKCVGSFKSPDRVSRDWAYGLTSLS